MGDRVLEKELARLMDLLSHENRIALLKGIDAGKTPQAIADECGVSRQTLQGHITKLKEGNLIERHQDADPYRLTELGAELLAKVQEIETEIVQKSIQESGEEKLAEHRKTLEEIRQLAEADVGFESPFTPEEWEILLSENANKDDDE